MEGAEQLDGDRSPCDLHVDRVDGFTDVGRQTSTTRTSVVWAWAIIVVDVRATFGSGTGTSFPVSGPGVCMHRRATLSVPVAHPVAHLSGKASRAGPVGPALTWTFVSRAGGT